MRGRKLLSVLLAVMMLLSLSVNSWAAGIPGGEDLTGQVVILHTNDIHGAVTTGEGSLGMASVAQLKADYETRGAYVLLLDAGDAIQGATLVSLSQGKTAVAFMNAAGYDAAAPGNHEFDYGYENMTALAEQADFPYLSANISYNGTPAFPAHTIFAAPGGLKIGVFGLTTPETQTKTHPDKIRGVNFLAGDELFACAQAQVDELTAAGCDLIVCLGHLGIDDESKGNRSTDLLAAVSGIDLFIDGHSHSVVDGNASENQINGTMLVSTGSSFQHIGAVLYDGEGLTAHLLSPEDYDGVAAAVNDLVNAANGEVNAQLSAVFAETTVRLNGDRAPGNRTQETNLGDFVADALLWSARRSCGSHVAAAITNGGGIRATIEAGNITMNDLKAVFPFGNEVTVLTVTGAQLLEALEMATWCAPLPTGAFPQVSGIEFTLNTAYTYENGDPYGIYFRCAHPGRRVTNVTVDGQPLDLTASYTIATNDFTAAGGDTYYPFTLATGVYQTGVTLEDALGQYTQQTLGGVIGADYAQPKDRITINSLPTDVAEAAWYADAVLFAYANGLMGSVEGSRFDPDGSVTRGQVYQALYNAAGKPEVTEPSTFTDIEGRWYEDAAIWAQSVDLTDGVGGALFAGDRAMTRQELAKALVDYSENLLHALPQAYLDLSGYSDAGAVADWAYGHMVHAVSLDILSGSYGKLNPTGTATRAQFAQMLLNLDGLEATYVETAVEIPVPAQRGVPAHTVRGILTTPTLIREDVPAVVLLHDIGSDKNGHGGGLGVGAPYMATHGITALRIDFIGSGASSGRHSDFSFTSAVADAKAAADFLTRQQGINGDAIGVLGWGQGGTIALLAAAEHDVFDSVVTWGTSPDLSGLMTEQNYRTAKDQGYFLLKLGSRDPLRMGRQWCDDVREVDVLARFAQSKAPVLAIHGADDTHVDPAHAVQIAAASPGSQAYLLRDCDHFLNLFSGDYTRLSDAVFTSIEHFQNTLK